MRIPVSAPQNIWFNAQNVDDTNLKLEQNYNNQVQAGIINNHLGTGVLLEGLAQKTLFASELLSGLLDGKALDPQDQPTDKNLGNQLEVELTNSSAAGKRTVKVFVVGLDFQNDLQYDRFTFHLNEKQLSKKHYTRVLKVLVNDLIGDGYHSFNLGGQLDIREAKAFSLSRDVVMASQDFEPNIFLRDFFVSTQATLVATLQNALPSYNIDNLNITTGFRQLRGISPNDVSSQVGQKFLASTNNIQKITLLMSIANDINPLDLVWTGDLIVSIYQLQSTIDCPTDISPKLAIEFHPSNVPLAQLSLNYNSLKDAGTVLDTVPQPVDFVFSNTPIANGNIIKPGFFYAVTVKRAGSANKGIIQFAVGSSSKTTNARETIFNGNIWVDVPEEALWFEIFSDAAKISDGQAYDNGRGITIQKTSIDPDTGATVDFSLDQIQFVRNDVYYGLVASSELQTTPIQDERTGNPVFSQHEFIPNATLVNAADLLTFEKVSDPLLIGSIVDRNVKVFDSSTSIIASNLHSFSMIGNECMIKIIDDPTDGYRYDLTVLNLVTEIINGETTNAKFIPDLSNPSVYYRIAKAELLTMMYGDVNGDGLIDNNDLMLAQDLLGADLNISPTLKDYITLTNPFKNDSSLLFNVIDAISLVILGASTDGSLAVNSLDVSRGTFHSSLIDFTSITNIGSRLLVISGSSNPSNNGTFQIVGLIDAHNISIRKKYYIQDTILQIFRADIDNDMDVDTNDTTLITNYVNKALPFPAPTLPGSRVGTQFRVIRLTLEEYIDRADNYPSIGIGRSTLLHPVPDIFVDGYVTFANHNFLLSPLAFDAVKQLNWQDYLVPSVFNPRLVPAAFIQQQGFEIHSCTIEGVVDDLFPEPPTFDPGRNDFFIPNNLIINNGGEIVRPDGYFYKVDMEIGTVIFEIPAFSFTCEKTINVLTDFVADYDGLGHTRLGHISMKFADCSFVKLDALALNQLRFSVAIQSLSPQINGIDEDDISGVIVDGKIGVFMNNGTGLLTFNFSNLYEDPILQTLNTKVQLSVFIKKAGWNNTPLFVGSAESKNILDSNADNNCKFP